VGSGVVDRKSRRDEKLRIFNTKDYGGQNVNVAPICSQNGGFQPQILHFWAKIFRRKNFSRLFREPKILREELFLPLLPQRHYTWNGGGKFTDRRRSGMRPADSS